MALTDRRIAALAKQYKQLATDMNEAKKQQDTIKAKVLAELDRRGTRMLEVMGVKTTMVQQERVTYNWDYLAEVLPPRMLRRIQKQEVDPQRLAEAVTAGLIDPVVVAAASTVTPTSAYISVSVASGS